MIIETEKHLADRVTQHGYEYLTELEPCIVERRDNGDIVCDDTHPAWRTMLEKYRKSRLNSPPQQQYPNGLGTLAAQGIDAVSFGLAKPVASAISSIFGAKSCGCDARAQCLNELVPDATKIDALSWASISWKILKCIGVKD